MCACLLNMHASLIQPLREAAFVGKPRGRAMVYRDWVCSLSPVVMGYVGEISRHSSKGDDRAAACAL